MAKEWGSFFRSYREENDPVARVDPHSILYYPAIACQCIVKDVRHSARIVSGSSPRWAFEGRAWREGWGAGSVCPWLLREVL